MLSFGTSVFILPFDLVTGGVSGIAIVLDKILPFEFLSIDIIVTVLTWVLFLLGLFILGKNFAVKTLVSTVIYPLGVSLFIKLTDPSFLNGFFCLQASEYSEISLILATVLGGALVGAGCAVTFIGGGSTGGVDIIAFTVCKIFKRLKSSVVIFAIDATIVALGMFVIGDFVLSLLGILSAFVAAFMVDKVFLGSSKSFIAQIISDNHEKINREIIQRLDRSTTKVSAVGGYTGNEKIMLMVSFKVNQYAELLNIINKADKNAFVTIHQAHEINGEGWTR
jgi:uncharacterized membrane-anchored protein YitT (DUF2179 family)